MTEYLLSITDTLKERLQQWRIQEDCVISRRRIKQIEDVLEEIEAKNNISTGVLLQAKKLHQTVSDTFAKNRKATVRASRLAPKRSIPLDCIIHTKKRKTADVSEEGEDLSLDAERKMDDENQFALPTPGIQDEILTRVNLQRSKEKTEVFICSVCDMQVQFDRFKRYDIQHFLSEDTVMKSNMKKRLRSPEQTLPQELISYYDCSAFSDVFSNLLLSKSGFNASSNSFCICTTCENSLRRSDIHENPPRMSIANNFWIGELPDDLFAYNWVEHMMCAPSHVLASTVTLKGNQHKALTSHTMCFDSSPVPFAKMLPRDVNRNGFIQVVLAGPFTLEQDLLCRRAYDVSVSRLYDLLDWYTDPSRRSYIYSGITIDRDTDFSEVNSTLIREHGSFCDESHIEDEMDSVTRTDSDAISNDGSTVIANDSVFVSTNQLSETAETELLKMKHDVFVARTSTNFQRQKIWSGEILAFIFPELFPYGRGHPAESRRKKVSFASCVKRYLKLSSGRFRNHRLFTLVAFDMISVSRTTLGCNIKCKFMNLHELRLLNSVTTEQVSDFLNKNKKQLPENVRSLFHKVSSSLTYMWGSNEERTQAGEKGYAMMNFYGNPHIFGTLTPNANGNFSVAFRAGKIDIDTLFDPKQSPDITKAKLYEFSSHNPTASATFFDDVMNLFFSDLIGWNAKTKRPTRKGGIFGHIRAFCGSTETQGTGNLHCHFMIWLVGQPPTVESFENIIEKENAEDRLKSYVQSVVSHSLPISASEMKCTKCETPSSLRPLAIPMSARMSTVIRGAAPKVAACAACGRCYSSNEINLNLLYSKQELLEYFGYDVTGNEDYSKLLHEILAKEKNLFYRVNSMHVDLPLEPAALTKVLLMTNWHRWQHSASCFKVSARTKKFFYLRNAICRYLYPFEQVSSTDFEDGKVHLQRNLGSEYLNGFNSTICRIFRCNHDVQILLTSSKHCEMLYYMFKYTWKPQQSLYAKTVATIASFERRKLAERCDPELTDLQKSRRAIACLAISTTNKREIAAPLCALYLLRGSPFYYSHEFASLHLGNMLRLLDTGTIELNLHESTVDSDDDEPSEQNTFYTSTSIQDYMCRPSALEFCSYYFFTSDYETVSTSSSNSLEFLPEHSQYKNKRVKMRTHVAIPSIIGPRLPCNRSLHSIEAQELYSSIALILFKPFRETDALKGAFATYSEAWTSFRPTERATRILRNLQNYHDLRNKAKSTEDIIRSSEENFHMDDVHEIPATQEQDDCFDDDRMQYEIMEDDDNELHVVSYGPTSTEDTFILQPIAASPTKCFDLLNKENITTEDRNFKVDMRMCKKMMKTTEMMDEDVAVGDLITAERQASFRRINDCIQISNRLFEESKVTDLIPEFPTISQVSSYFNLNFEQHVAFDMVAVNLLLRWSGRCSSSEKFFLGGEGGTGKSRVVHCLLHFVTSWKKIGSLLVTAWTGKAAICVHGSTVHSVFGYQNLETTQGFKLSPKQRLQLTQADVIIIDECSMLSRKIIARISALLKWHRSKDDDYGGCAVLLCGDFFQMPPIMGKSLYDDVTESPEDSEGHLLWQKHKRNSIVLTTNVRQIKDLRWAAGCASARKGDWTQEFIDMINSRSLEEIRTLAASQQEFTPIVSPKNSTRYSINLLYTKEFLSANPAVVCYRLPAKLLFKDSSLQPSDLLLSKIFKMRDDQLEKIPPFLDLFLGIPLQVTQNISVPLGIINGGTFRLFSVQWKIDTRFTKHFDATLNAFVMIPNVAPDCLFLQSLDKKERWNFPGVPKSVFPLFLYTARRFYKIDNCVSVKLTQFPCVCAIGCSVYKVQGESLDRMIIASWWSNNSIVDSSEQGYVMISRLTSLQGLYILEKLTPAIAKNFKPPESVLLLDEELRDSSTHNLNKFRNLLEACALE